MNKLILKVSFNEGVNYSLQKMKRNFIISITSPILSTGINLPEIPLLTVKKIVFKKLAHSSIQAPEQFAIWIGKD